jgi:hypothetical protein
VPTIAGPREFHDGLKLLFTVLIHLHDALGIDQNMFSERMALDRTSTGELVYRLKQQRLVERQVNGLDRRARILRLHRAVSHSTTSNVRLRAPRKNVCWKS